MRAFVVSAPGVGAVEEVPEPEPKAGQAIADVERVGVCGTDIELFDGTMSYLHSGLASYPIRLGHEWAGTVSAVAEDVDPAWIGQRVMGDTMIGDGTCSRCRRGRPHVCSNVSEVGMHGYDGALAERIAIPVASLHVLPGPVDPTLGALVEPGGNALRAARATRASRDDTVLVIGAGTIGLLTAMFLEASGAEVHVVDERPERLHLARQLGLRRTWPSDDVSAAGFAAVVDASNDPGVPSRAVELVEPAGRVVFIGLAGEPSTIDTRRLALKDVTAVGILSGAGAFDETIALFASGRIHASALVAGTVPLDRAADVLSGWRPADAGLGPKLHIDPQA